MSTAMATASARREYCYGCWVSILLRLYCVRLCYGCCINQERISMSEIPTAPPLLRLLACSLRTVGSVNSAHSEI